MKAAIVLTGILGLMALTGPATAALREDPLVSEGSVALTADKDKHQKKHGGGHHSSERRRERSEEGRPQDPGRIDGGRGLSRTEQVINLSLVLLIPAAIGVVGGRLLRRAPVKHAS